MAVIMHERYLLVHHSDYVSASGWPQIQQHISLRWKKQWRSKLYMLQAYRLTIIP